MGNVSVSLLGGFAARVDGVPVQDAAWRLRKARELVKLLALAPGHRLHREQAMDVLWRDRAPAAAANNLHQAIYVARRALDHGAIVVQEESLQLVAEVDVDRLQDAAVAARRAGTPAAYRAALALYAGELLPENRYDDWADSRREELAELAADLARRAGASAAAPPPLAPLPVDPSSFIGRERELAELAGLLGGTRLLTLAGTGGVGKTRLALELARASEPLYVGGAALVKLAALDDGRLVPDAVAAALEVRPLPGQTLIDAMADFVAPDPLLLVIDNCEHLLAAVAALVDALLRAAPELTVLATSREPLHVPGEVVFRIPSLDIPDPEEPLEPGDLLRYEAVQLFVERARAAAPGFTIDAADALDVARICFRLDGLPLALELAAGRLGALTPAAIAERLDAQFRVLGEARHASPTRQQTLSATLQWSHDLLGTEERTLFRRLAVFAGGFALDAVESVCTGEGLEAPATADVLARLVEKSLVAVENGSSRERRYRLLETVRLYAHARLAEAGEIPALSARHARWALTLAEHEHGSAGLDPDTANLRVGLTTLLKHAPDDAVRLCVALWPFWMRRLELAEARRRFETALAATRNRTALRARALLRAAAIDFRSGELSRASRLAAESHSIASELGDAYGEWRALQFHGECGFARDAADVATQWLEQALALARREGFGPETATGVYSLGVASWILGDAARAEELVGESADLFAGLSGSSELVISPVNLSEIRSGTTGSRPGLRIVFEDTLQPFLEVRCDAALAYVLMNRAALVGTRGDLPRARDWLDEAAWRFHELRDERGIAAVLVRRAYLELAGGDAVTARVALEEALELRRNLGDRRGVGLALAGLALIDTAGGDYAEAERNLAEARSMFRRGGDRWGLAATLWRTADLDFARGRIDDAEAALQEARTVLVATGRDRWIAVTLAALAEVAVVRGDRQRALTLFTAARDRYAAKNDARGIAEVDARLHGLLLSDV